MVKRSSAELLPLDEASQPPGRRLCAYCVALLIFQHSNAAFWLCLVLRCNVLGEHFKHVPYGQPSGPDWVSAPCQRLFRQCPCGCQLWQRCTTRTFN